MCPDKKQVFKKCKPQQKYCCWSDVSLPMIFKHSWWNRENIWMHITLLWINAPTRLTLHSWQLFIGGVDSRRCNTDSSLYRSQRLKSPPVSVFSDGHTDWIWWHALLHRGAMAKLRKCLTDFSSYVRKSIRSWKVKEMGWKMGVSAGLSVQHKASECIKPLASGTGPCGYRHVWCREET